MSEKTAEHHTQQRRLNDEEKVLGRKAGELRAEGVSEHQIDAEAVVQNYMLWTGAAGVIPMPLVDFVAISSIQLAMLKKIGDIYGFSFSSNLGKSLISSLTGSYAASALGHGIGRSLLRSIPIIGGITSILAMPGFAAASTYALGKVFILHFESGGTFLDFDPVKSKEYYAKFLKSKMETKTEAAAK
ncbi:YcjF family protein [Mucilaginibacter calamicampi]|uniref:YcjF family protein n=1 Tax=Mucilaginibacter calamicampi TaxID=1302352 RepID=A0ABW2YTV7_9SPHI